MPTLPGYLSFGFAALSCALVACGAAPESDHPSGTTSSSSTAPTPSASASACGKTLAAYCAGEACLDTWSDADTVCMNALPGGPSVTISAPCGSFFALQEAGTTAWYDSTTSALVAVVDATGTCLGGPADFAAPNATACYFSQCGPMSCGGAPDSSI